MAVGKRSLGWRSLRGLIIFIGVCLTPVFFGDMLVSVSGLLWPYPHWHRWAYAVPAATEGSFLLLFLLDVLLLLARKPMGWLRYPPYVFAALSVVMNVWAGHGQPVSMAGHFAITVAFFVPLIAAERAIRAMSVPDIDLALTAETKAAMLHARDLIRSQVGWWHAPKLLRVQVRHSRPPAKVASAIRQGAQSGGAEAWEAVVEQWVTDALTATNRIAASVAQEQHRIEAQAIAPDASGDSAETDTGTHPSNGSGRTPERGQGRTPGDATGRIRKPTPAQVRAATPDALVDYVSQLLEDDPTWSARRLGTHLHCRPEKAGAALKLARQSAEIIQLAERTAT